MYSINHLVLSHSNIISVPCLVKVSGLTCIWNNEVCNNTWGCNNITVMVTMMTFFKTPCWRENNTSVFLCSMCVWASWYSSRDLQCVWTMFMPSWGYRPELWPLSSGPSLLPVLPLWAFRLNKHNQPAHSSLTHTVIPNQPMDKSPVLVQKCTSF